MRYLWCACNTQKARDSSVEAGLKCAGPEVRVSDVSELQRLVDDKGATAEGLAKAVSDK